MSGPEQPGGPSLAPVRAALCAVAGVSRVEVVGAVGDGSAAVRLTLTDGADEVAVMTAADEVLRQGFGLCLDPSRIELVEESAPYAPRGSRFLTVPPDLRAGPAGRPRPATAPMGRPVIVRAVVSSDGEQVCSEVQLGWAGHTYAGVCRLSADRLHLSVARATGSALESMLEEGPPARITDVGVAVQSLDEVPVALVRLALRVGERTDWLTGACEVRADPVQALVRATLAAVNRRLEPLLAGRAGGPDRMSP
jgi:hypothetical protein